MQLEIVQGVKIRAINGSFFSLKVLEKVSEYDIFREEREREKLCLKLEMQREL